MILWLTALNLANHLVSFDGFGPSVWGDKTLLVCHLISKENVFKRLVWLCGCQLLTCHHITTFNGKKLCGSRDIDKAILHYFMRHTCLNDCITLCVKGPYCNSPPLMTIDFMAVNLQDHVIKGSNHKPNGSKLTRPCNQGILLLYWKKLLFCVTNVPCLVTVIVVVVEI